MIALYKPQNYNNVFARTFREYDSGRGILDILYGTIKDILRQQEIPENKINVLNTYIETYKQTQDLTNTNIIKRILIELEENVIPLFNNRFATKSNYDIIGKFYEEFLKYAGVSNVKKGIVLTPKHITTLFTKLIDIRNNDVIMDLCCGTGAFLIAGMNKLIELIENSDLPNKEERINNIKQNQLLGFELNSTMYICSISNMLFRGDGKSKIYNMDSINGAEVDRIINEMRPTIGFINPPYSGKENETNTTPKEITFVTKMLDNCSRYGIVIAPLSMYFKDKDRRQQILQRHTLKYVINMPADLFKPNASTYTAVAVFETNRPHQYENDKVKFYDFDDDGLVMTVKGRTDIYDRYREKEKNLLEFLQNDLEDNDEKYKKISCTINKDDE
nr:N-6 DNA methylase [Mycoplasma phocoeninasale]